MPRVTGDGWRWESKGGKLFLGIKSRIAWLHIDVGKVTFMVFRKPQSKKGKN
jgi:hypothetical protein